MQADNNIPTPRQCNAARLIAVNRLAGVRDQLDAVARCMALPKTTRDRLAQLAGACDTEAAILSYPHQDISTFVIDDDCVQVESIAIGRMVMKT